ncbi:MAG: M23 family metallopeptidase [candidate division WOR-3 bacterium]
MQKWSFKIKLLYPTTHKKEIEITVRPWMLKVFLSLLCIISIGIGYTIFRYTQFEVDAATLSHLKSENARLKEEVSRLKSEAKKVNNLLNQIIESTNKLRLAAGLDPVPKEFALMGMGGNIEEFPAENKNELEYTKSEINRLLNLAQFQIEVLSEVSRKLEEDSKVREHTPSIVPTAGYFTSGFGLRRDPFTGQISFHEAIDIAAPVGTPIVAPAAGIVKTVRWEQGFGLMLEIDHGYGITTRYAHLLRAKVSPGQYVKRGELIAYVGNSGRSTAPHLHYEVRINDKPVNPVNYIIPAGIYYD